MLELLNNAWNGWGNYIFYGKYPALLLLVLVVFWFFSDRKKEPVLLGYTTVMTVCCICPLTAALLMQYQTKFYDYQWVWSYVPLTIVVALAGTLVLGHCRELNAGCDKQGNGREKLIAKAKVPAAALMIVVLILLCGRMTDPLTNVKTDWQQAESAEPVVKAIAETVGKVNVSEEAVAEESAAKETVVLWAPKEIMAAVRIYRPDIQLLYGRDLWDASLGAYTYDTYTQVEDDLCQWMHCTGVFGTIDGYRLDGTVLDGKTCVEQALKLGVNCIVVPNVMTQEACAELTEILEAALVLSDVQNDAEGTAQIQSESALVQMSQLEAYYIFTWN